MTWIDMSIKRQTNLQGQFLQNYNRQNNSKKSGRGTGERFQSTWKCQRRLELLKSGVWYYFDNTNNDNNNNNNNDDNNNNNNNINDNNNNNINNNNNNNNSNNNTMI